MSIIDHDVITLSESPYIAYVPEFLTNQECDYFVSKANAIGLKPATTYSPSRDEYVPDPARDSWVAKFICQDKNQISQRVSKRLSHLLKTNVLQHEPFQVMRYQEGERYLPHYDFFPERTHSNPWWNKSGGQRVWTVLMYLNQEYQGGETAFLNTNLKIKGEKGGALIFRNLTQDGSRDVKTVHLGMPATEGEKWVVSLWTRQNHYKEMK